jgi:CBS domain-containing protein
MRRVVSFPHQGEEINKRCEALSRHEVLWVSVLPIGGRKAMQRARDVMSKNVEVIRESETISQVAKRLADSGVGSMPICDGDRLRGVITDRDIVTKVIARGKDPDAVRAQELETGKPVTIGADDSIEEALQTMVSYKVRRLPVIDGHSLVGMVSQADLAKALPRERAGELIAAISSD